MSKKKPLVIICAAVLLGSALTISRNAFSERTPRNNSAAQHAEPHAPYIVPEHVMYGYLFRKVAHDNGRIRALQAQKRITQTPHLPLLREAGLTSEQARALSEIAAACERQVGQQDERARVIISAFRAQFPNGIIPKGAPPPLPPPELQAMWEERNTIILRARDRLRAALGEETFARLDNFVKFRYGANAGPTSLNPLHSISNHN